MENKIKILHIVDKYGYGGVETIVDALISNFDNTKFEMSYYFLRDLKTKAHLSKKNVFIKKYSKFSPLPLWDLFKNIQNNEIDIVHTHHLKGFYLASVLSLFLSRIKFIHHEHGDLLQRNFIYKCALFLLSHKITALICVSPYISEVAQKKYKFPHAKLFVLESFVKIPESIVTGVYRADGQKNCRIGFLGRLSKVKGCHYLIQSFAQLTKDDNKYELLIAGDGPEKKYLEKLVQSLNLQNHVKFLGSINGFEEIKNKIDIVAIPSDSEASPVVLLEAWAFGIPVIISNIDSICAIVKHRFNVLTFEKQNVKDLAEKIVKLSTDSSLRNMLINNGREKVSEFSIEKYLSSLENIYCKVSTQNN